MDGIREGNWQKTELSKVLQERTEKNINGYTVCSVSVSQGVINQIEYLGRSFAAKETSHYNLNMVTSFIQKAQQVISLMG